MSKASNSELVGLEIDETEVRLAVAAPAGAGYVVQCRRRALPAGSVESGCVGDAEGGISLNLPRPKMTRPIRRIRTRSSQMPLDIKAAMILSTMLRMRVVRLGFVGGDSCGA